MARGRKALTIKVLTNRDKDLMKQLSRTGLCNSMQAKEHCGLTRERLKKLEKSGYIRTSEHILRGKNNLVIQLNKQGKEYCRQEFGVTSFCTAQTNHLVHDIKLTEVYYRLETKIQDTWKHERDLIKEYYERYPQAENRGLETCIDATIQINGEVIAIESIGCSYTSSTIEVKERIAKALGCSRMECV